MPEDRVTEPVRIYRGDKAMIERMARGKSAESNITVTPADVIRELLAQQQLGERAAERQDNGTV